MEKAGILLFFSAVMIGCTSQHDNTSNDYLAEKEAINQTISEWDHAWETKDVALAIKHYADSTDWTNAFGDRVQSKNELEELLTFIFNLDFVMSGKNNYGKNEITFLNDSSATVRSQNIRSEQLWLDGTPMDDRIINHLRVYKKTNGDWLITDHMISQAWPKQVK